MVLRGLRGSWQMLELYAPSTAGVYDDIFVLGGTMDTNAVLALIDKEIAHLRQARAILMADDSKQIKAGKGIVRRKLSAAARKRIADAQKKRWAAVKAKK
jgi:hypothetical protein